MQLPRGRRARTTNALVLAGWASKAGERIAVHARPHMRQQPAGRRQPIMHGAEAERGIMQPRFGELAPPRFDRGELGLMRHDRARKQLIEEIERQICLLYTSPSPRDGLLSRMPSSA